MTEEEVKMMEEVTKRLHPDLYSAIQRLEYRLSREHGNTWRVSINYNDGEGVVIVTDTYGARVETRVEQDGTYKVMVYDNWFYTGIAVRQEAAAMQVMRLELEHQRFTMPHLYRAD